jgi:hypothetical protein
MERIDGRCILKTIETICAFGTRWMGGPGAEKAIAYAKDQFESNGLIVNLQAFPYLHYQPLSASLLLKGRQVNCQPIALSPSTKQPVEADLVYGGACSPSDLSRLKADTGDLSDTIVVSDNLRTFVAYPEVEAAGAAGFIAITDLPDNTIRCGCARLDGKSGKIPGVAIGGVDGRELIAALSEGKKNRAVMQAQGITKEKIGHNIIARPPFQQQTKQLLVTAHYDCFWNGVMAMDNCAGMATVLELNKSFTPQMLAKSTFVIFGAEELGCWGSAAFVKELLADFHTIRAVLNLDTFGSDRSGIEIGVTQDLEQTCRRVEQESGIKVDVWNIPPRAASDHQKFVENGLPAVWIANGGTDTRYHTALDTPSLMSAKNLEAVANLAYYLAAEIIRHQP